MSLSERFAMYQRKAAEAEMRKPRKSPEIHRYGKPSRVPPPPTSAVFISSFWFLVFGVSCVGARRPNAALPSRRRIDVSPSAFKRHSHVFEDTEEASYKVTGPF